MDEEKISTDVTLTKTPGAYRIEDESNNVVYVGSSGNLYQRFHEHKSQLKKGVNKNPSLQKYSAEHKLKFVPIPTTSKEEAFDVEQKLIDTHVDNGVLCNRSRNARVHAQGHVITEETQRKMALSRIGTKRSPETRAKMSATRMGFRISDETRKKISETKRSKVQK